MKLSRLIFGKQGQPSPIFVSFIVGVWLVLASAVAVDRHPWLVVGSGCCLLVAIGLTVYLEQR